MHPKSPKWLEDILTACTNIEVWTTGSSAASYQRDARLRLAVERSFEIIGEALVRIERADPNTVARITDYRQIIGFRNVLAHQYDDTDASRCGRSCKNSCRA